MRPLNPQDLIPLNAFVSPDIGGYPIEIDLVYADAEHPDNHFRHLYSEEARILWAHKDIAAVTLLAACLAHYHFGWTFKLNDCLRPVEAQEGMLKYDYHPSLVSTPGNGAHPRAMAIDIECIKGGQLIDMGVPFDHFSKDPEVDNPAGRHYTKFPAREVMDIRHNRGRLETVMLVAATMLGCEIMPLADEFWDFRFDKSVWGEFEPLREADLLPCQRLIDIDVAEAQKILNRDYPDFMKANLQAVNQKVAAAFFDKLLQDGMHRDAGRFNRLLRI